MAHERLSPEELAPQWGVAAAKSPVTKEPTLQRGGADTILPTKLASTNDIQLVLSEELNLLYINFNQSLVLLQQFLKHQIRRGVKGLLRETLKLKKSTT